MESIEFIGSIGSRAEECLKCLKCAKVPKIEKQNIAQSSRHTVQGVDLFFSRSVVF